MSRGYVLYGGAGTGAVAVEAALRIAGQGYELIDAPATDAPAGVAPANPMGQVPVLILPDGERMTESAAILLRLAELHPDARLAPGVGDPGRSAYLRWMSFVSSAIYAHFWVKDDPSRLVADTAVHDEINRAIEARISECWGIMNREVDPGRYILGDDLGVLDLYVTVVSRFRPRRQRFYEAAPKLEAVVKRVDVDPRLASLWAERYPFFEGWDVAPPV
jgi:GST-like protein